jgi:apoptosis-inducing factor 3
MDDKAQSNGPDLTSGISGSQLTEGAMLVGHVGDEPVLLARHNKEVFAISATCTHYGGPLGEGLMVDGTVRCPWHHSCFSLRTGEALSAPAFTPTACWRVEHRNDQIFVQEKIVPAPQQLSAKSPATNSKEERIVIVGGGAAGYAAAEMLRRKNYSGRVTIISADDAAPYDRPNLSKDYLAGSAPEEWIPLNSNKFYDENDIELRLRTTATAIDVPRRRVSLGNGEEITFTKLLIATGAEPIRLNIPGAELPHVRTLRSLADSREIIARTKSDSRVVIVGASFIGLEAAAALRHRDAEVHVVAPETRPMERVLGPALGDFLHSLHKSHGVVFHLGHTLASIEPRQVKLDDGSRIDADLVLAGIGVRPRLDLAEGAGLAIDHGVLVNEYLETSSPDIFAAGDIARWPDPYNGERLRIEHWVVSERQGQTAALNMLGRRERYTAVPFFWSRHYDVSIDYVGHASSWDHIAQDGDIAARNAILRFQKGGQTLAVATIGRNLESLKAELAMASRSKESG